MTPIESAAPTDPVDLSPRAPLGNRTAHHSGGAGSPAGGTLLGGALAGGALVGGALVGTSLVAGAVLLAIGTSGPAVAADPDPTPIEVFQKHYRDRDPKVRRKAVEQLADAHGPQVIAALLEGLADEDERVRGAAERLLTKGRTRADEIEALVAVGLGRRPPEVRALAARALVASGSLAHDPLVAALSDREAVVREIVVRGLGARGDIRALRALHEVLADDEPLVRAAAIEAIGLLAGEDAVGAATALVIADRSGLVCVAAVETMTPHPRESSMLHLERGVRDGHWPMRVASARALARYGYDTDLARRAVATLVPVVERDPRLRVREEVADSLFRLTGIDFGADPERWTAWYDEAGKTFEPPERAPRRSRPSEAGTHAGLLDLPIGSDHVTFVIDMSHSMNDPIRFGVKTTKRDALLAAFERAVDRLPDGAAMNVIAFGTEARAYKDHLFAATRNARKAAVKFLAKRAPDGRTNIYDSLTLALTDTGVDTLVLVTDGAPSEGEEQTRTGILEGLAEQNRFRYVRVHTVEIGSKNTSRRWRGFLRQIAEQTGGHYLER